MIRKGVGVGRSNNRIMIIYFFHSASKYMKLKNNSVRLQLESKNLKMEYFKFITHQIVTAVLKRFWHEPETSIHSPKKGGDP